jgi:hypothetical protein
MKIKDTHIHLSVRQNSDFLAGYLPAEEYGCGMCFIELKYNL